MMAPYILFIIMHINGAGGSSIQTQQFNSKASCEKAAEMARTNIHGIIDGIFCTEM